MNTWFVKVAYVGDLINHGKSLRTPGTSIVILLSKIDNIDSIDIYCPEQNEEVEDFILPNKVKIVYYYKWNSSRSLLRLLSLRKDSYDFIIFNVLPTGFGNKSLPNFIGLMVPLSLKILFRLKNVRVIYHNSVFTNDIRKLGYDSPFNRVRAFFLGIYEQELFKNVDTFVLLELYKNRITEKIGPNKVKVMKGSYLDAITSIYINCKMTEELRHVRNDPPIILMHGAWGPQKDLELGLSSLLNLKQSGKNFKLVLSGGINHHFLWYEREFSDLIVKYSDIVNTYRGYIIEKDIMELFLMADIVVLPYNVPGGQSGVLEEATFFEVPTVAMDFPEYLEETVNSKNVVLSTKEGFEENLCKLFNFIPDERCVSVKDKVAYSIKNISILINGESDENGKLI